MEEWIMLAFGMGAILVIGLLWACKYLYAEVNRLKIALKNERSRIDAFKANAESLREFYVRQVDKGLQRIEEG